MAAVLEMQHALQNTAWPDEEQVRVRIGIHCGEAEQTVTGLVGLEVHRAARIAAAAHGGQGLVWKLRPRWCGTGCRRARGWPTWGRTT